MDLMDKIGINAMHNNPGARLSDNLTRAIDFAHQAGMKWFRPGFNLQPGEFNGTYDPWREYWYLKLQDLDMIGIVGAFPQQLVNHLLDDNADELVDKAVTAYTKIIDGLLNAGVDTDHLVVEAWNEGDGKFAVSDQSIAESNDEVITRYLTFNMKLCSVAHSRGVRFIDFCSIQYPKSPALKHVMDRYNDMLTNYATYPDRVSFHPYCERAQANVVPETYLLSFDTSEWNNIDQFQKAVTEFGYPSEDWGNPFSGKWPFQYARDLMIRQIIIQDYLNIDPIIVYSGNTNDDPATADKDDCWGTYQWDAKTQTVHMSDLGRAELKFFQEMQGYHLVGMVSPDNHYTITEENAAYTNYAFEYADDDGNSKLFYWCPFGNNQANITWQGTNYTLQFNQHVGVINAATK